jgi:hypothetical protein
VSTDVSTAASIEASIDDKRIAEWLFVLTFAVYAWFFGGAGWNQNAAFDLTRAIVEQHSFAIDSYADNSGDVSFANGHVYSNKPPGLSFLAAIPYLAVDALVGPPEGAMPGFAEYVVVFCTVGLLGALVPALLYRAGRRRGIDPLWCATVALSVAFATELFPYASLLMVAVPSGALMLYALEGRRDVWAGLAGGLAAAMNYLCLPALVAFALVRRSRSFIAGALPALVALLVYQRICFGSFFANSVSRTNPRFLSRDAALGVLGAPSFEALYGITISPYRGLFFFAPVLLLAVVPLARERVILGISLFFLGFNVCFNGWEGGFGVGARYLVPLIPLWGLALLRARPRALFVALAAVSFAINFTATAVDPQPSGTIPRPLTQYLIPLLVRGHFSADVPITPPWSAATFTGHTSVNRMAHDEAVVFQKHAPGSVESEWASFNLGEPFFGAGSAASLIPIVVLLGAGGAAILWRARRGSRSPETTAPRSV